MTPRFLLSSIFAVSKFSREGSGEVINPETTEMTENDLYSKCVFILIAAKLLGLGLKCGTGRAPEYLICVSSSVTRFSENQCF